MVSATRTSAAQEGGENDAARKDGAGDLWKRRDKDEGNSRG